MLQICEAYGANRYPFPEDPARQRQMHGEVRRGFAMQLLCLLPYGWNGCSGPHCECGSFHLVGRRDAPPPHTHIRTYATHSHTTTNTHTYDKQVTTRLRELHHTIETGDRHREGVLQQIAFNLDSWAGMVGAPVCLLRVVASVSLLWICSNGCMALIRGLDP